MAITRSITMRSAFMTIRNVASSCFAIAFVAIALGGCAFGQTGIIATVAGSWAAGFNGDNGAAINAQLNLPNAVAVDAQGNIYFADNAYPVGFATPVGGYTPRVRKVNAATGIITTVAGNGLQGFSGDNGPANAAELGNVAGLAVDSGGNLFIADIANQRIRRVDAVTGIITTVAGGGTANPGDGAGALGAALIPTGGLAMDSSGNLYIGDSYVIGQFSIDGVTGNIYAYRIREVAAATGIITTIAGVACPVANESAGACYGGDGGPAINAQIFDPVALAVDNIGNVFLAANGRVREISAATGIISTIAGNGTSGFAGDGGPATSAAVWWSKRFGGGRQRQPLYRRSQE